MKTLKYRRVMNALYKFDEKRDAYVHCAIIPPSVKGLRAAVVWYENRF